MNTIEKAGHRTIIKLATVPVDPTAFDAYEIAQVAESAGGECYTLDGDEAVSRAEEEGHKVFWTVYGHIPNQGVDAIADRDSYASCLDLLRQMGVIDQGQIEAALCADNDPVIAWGDLAETLREARDVLNRLVTSSTLGVDPITQARRIIQTIDSYDL